MNCSIKLLQVLLLMFLLMSCASKGGAPLIVKPAEKLFDSAYLPMAKAVEHGDLVYLKGLPDSVKLASIRGEGGIDLLFLALRKEKYDTFEYLLQQGARLDHRWDSGKCTLYWLVMADNARFWNIASRYAADLNTACGSGADSMIFKAIGLKKETSIRFLLSKGIDYAALNQFGQTPLLHAAMFDNYPVVMKLISDSNLCHRDHFEHQMGDYLKKSEKVLRKNSEYYHALLRVAELFSKQCL